MSSAEATDTLPEPQVQIENAGPARKVIHIEVPAELIAAKLEDNFLSLQHEAMIPGFRRGHAPRKLLERRFGGDVRKEVTNQIVGESYTAAVEKNELRVLGQPDIKDADKLQLPDTGPMKIEIEVEVVPDVKLPELTGIEVKKPVVETGDAQIDAEINRIGELYGQPKPVDRSAHGDVVAADLTIKAKDGSVLEQQNGVRLMVPGESRKFKGVVAGILVEDLGNQLADHKPGDTVTIQATGPERHENEKLRGQELTIDAAITGVERMHPMTAEQLVEAMGLENNDQLRERVKEQLQRRAESQQRSAMSEQIIDHLLASTEVELPEKLSARQAENILRRRAMEMMYQGAKSEDIEQQLAELRASSEEAAGRELKSLFVIDAVARQLEIEVSEAEVNGRVAEMAAYRGIRPERAREEMAKGGQLEQLYVQLREEKAIARILQDAKVTDVPAEQIEAAPKKKTGGTKKKSTKKSEAGEE